MPIKPKLDRQDLIEPALSYQLVGISYRVFNELGPGLHEKYYEKAFAVALAENKILFKEQVPIPLQFSGQTVGKYFADFIIDNRIVIELKKGDRINRRQAIQLLAYLKVTKIKLGLLIYFGTDGVFVKRILNNPV